jgi:hypothetical protein
MRIYLMLGMLVLLAVGFLTWLFMDNVTTMSQPPESVMKTAKLVFDNDNADGISVKPSPIA